MAIAEAPVVTVERIPSPVPLEPLAETKLSLEEENRIEYVFEKSKSTAEKFHVPEFDVLLLFQLIESVETVMAVKELALFGATSPS